MVAGNSAIRDPGLDTEFKPNCFIAASATGEEHCSVKVVRVKLKHVFTEIIISFVSTFK